MPERLSFNVSPPHQYLSPNVQPAARVNTAKPIRDSISHRTMATQGISGAFGEMLNALKVCLQVCLQKIWDCLSCKKKQRVQNVQAIPTSPLVPELPIWQKNLQSMPRSGLGGHYVDLTGRVAEPGFCPALGMVKLPCIGHYAHSYPILSNLLTVKLPARQLQRFPDAIKNALSNYGPDQLDLYFMVWEDIPTLLEHPDPNQAGKRNIIYHPIAFPGAQEGQTHCQNLSMGIFDAEGIEVARGNPAQAMPWNQFGEQNVHIHPRDQEGHQVMCISPDHARFHLPSHHAWSTFHSACKLPNNRAVAVFGIIVNPERRHPVLLDALSRTITLEQYKAGIQNSQLSPSLKNKVAEMLEFSQR